MRSAGSAGRDARHWTVERTISWIQNYRPFCIRWETSSRLFAGSLHMTCALLLRSEALRQAHVRLSA